MVNHILLKSKEIELNVNIAEDGAYIENGMINSLQVVRAPLTTIKIQRLSDGREFSFDSTSGFEKTAVSRYADLTRITLFRPLNGLVTDFSLVIQARTMGNRIEWETFVINDNPDYSVQSADYPCLFVKETNVDAFIPLNCGIEEKGIVENNYQFERLYPQGWLGCTMQYFAFYRAGKGIYAGVHDKTGSLKSFSLKTSNELGQFTFETGYPAVSIGSGANAFELPGKMVWQSLYGDWYDAANIYREFVRKEALWIPEMDENGRTDTPAWFKALPFWVMDWMPNGPHKKDELPTSIRPRDGAVIPPNAWYETPIRLQKELGVPIGYHLYNWHMIPFNNDYPHFYPAQEGVMEGIKKLVENQVYVMPYINGLLWDTKDREDQDFMFGKVAKKWVIQDADGNFHTSSFESKEKNGEKVKLASMCPSSGVWRSQLAGVIDKLVNELKVPAVYIDQIAASTPKLCAGKGHNHLPGGGNWWIQAYETMLRRFQIESGDGVAFTSECEGEPYMKELDGFLTWIWLESNNVPAYTRVYSGCIVLFGRNSGGAKKSDTMYFKHSIANALLYGQQMGWINSDVVDNPERLKFLKKMVQLRYKYTKFFNCGDLLRPPIVECDLEDLEVEAQICHRNPQVIRHVVSGGWRLWDGTDTKIFVVNLADRPAHAVLRMNVQEYADKDCCYIQEGNGRILSVKDQGKDRIVEVVIGANDYLVL